MEPLPKASLYKTAHLFSVVVDLERKPVKRIYGRTIATSSIEPHIQIGDFITRR